MSDEQPVHHDERAPPTTGDSPHGVLDAMTVAWQQAKAAFAKSERRYRDLVEHSLGLICAHDLTGRLQSINPAAARSLGYEVEQGVGHNLADFLAPETRHLFQGYLRRIRDNGQDAGLMRVIARNGSERVWMYRNVLFEEPGSDPYVLGHAVDVTERIVAERTLREKEHALRRAHDELEGRVRERTIALEHANERLRLEIAERQRAEAHRERALIEQRDTLGFLAAVSEGLAPVVRFEQLLDVMRTLPIPFAADWTMVHMVAANGTIRSQPGMHIDRDRTAVLTRLGAAASGSLPFDCLIARAIATRQPIIVPDTTADLGLGFTGIADTVPLLQLLGMGSVAILPLVGHAQQTAVLSLGAAAVGRFEGPGRMIVEDLERRSRLALDRIRLYREAEEANRLKDEFLSTLSHELRTPLNAVYGWARVLRTLPLDQYTAHAVEVIERNTEAQKRLIEDVLDVSRIITGKMMLAMERLDVRAVLAAAFDAVRPALQAKRVRLEARLADDVPPVVGDPDRLQQVFWNVLSNAVKFTGADGLITVTLSSSDDWMEIQIADTGVGIRRDVLPFVFDRFRQADSSTSRSHGGLGLGLAIVRQVVELHGGTVKAESAGEAHGATFTITLPVDRQITAPTSQHSGPELSAAAQPPASLHGRKILVVEDHDDARELVANVLAAEGAEVMTASSTAEAFDLIGRSEPDVLVADLGLPGEDGFALLKRIRGMHAFKAKTLPAIALTAYARASDRERAVAAGFLHYVVKPVDPEELVRVIASMVTTSPPRASTDPTKASSKR
jgi:PAS domain S-box-containing protein